MGFAQNMGYSTWGNEPNTGNSGLTAHVGPTDVSQLYGSQQPTGSAWGNQPATGNLGLTASVGPIDLSQIYGNNQAPGSFAPSIMSAPVSSPMNQGTLNNMYASMLGRAPDASANGWLGQSQADVIRGIQNSSEYQQLHGLQTTPGVAVNGQPVAQPAPPPQAPQITPAQSAAQTNLDYLTGPQNPYATGNMDYNNYALRMKLASNGLGTSIRDSFTPLAPPANLAQLSQTPAWQAMTPTQQMQAMNPGTMPSAAPGPTPFQQAVSNITPYGAQYQANVAANPMFQGAAGQARLAQGQALQAMGGGAQIAAHRAAENARAVARVPTANPSMGQMFTQNRMMQTPQTQNMYGNLYGSLSNLLRQHQGP